MHDGSLRSLRILLLRIVTNDYYMEPNQSIIGYNDNVRDKRLQVIVTIS